MTLKSLGLTQRETLEAIQATEKDEPQPSQIFVVKSHLRLAQHFDIMVDLLIYDRAMGTVGFVYLLGEDGADLADEVRGRIDQATYARHLFLNDLELEARLPLTVELAFLTKNEHLHLIGNVLSGVASEAPSFLEAVGVNLLIYSANVESLSLSDVRRAFPWLLHATRAWYESRRVEPSATLTTIELLSYRLPGRRTLALQPSPVHLVFGQNGSGKSALVEALELAVTGKAERLAAVGEADYAGVIRNRGTAGPAPAQVILHLSDQSTIEREVGPEGISRPLSQGLRATSFRLDQVVMDRLTRGGDTQRAEIFLQSFFPTEHADLLSYQRSREEAEKALRELPKALTELLVSGIHDGEEPTEGMLRQLAWMAEPQNRLSPAVAMACLPLSAANIEALGGLSPELARLQAIWSQEPPIIAEAAALLGGIDEALARLRDSLPTVLATLQIAKQGLLRLDGWQATGIGTDSTRDFLADVNAWLRRLALTDLAERHCQLLEALDEARREGWEPEPNTIGPFTQPVIVAELSAQREQAAAWARERDELFQHVMTVAPTVEGSIERPSAEGLRLSHAQKAHLDIAGRWLQLSATNSNQPLLLGQMIDQALNTDSSVQAGDIVVGTGVWTQQLLARLGRLEEAVRALQESNTEGGHNLQTLKDLRSSYEALKEAGTKVEQNFLRQLQGTQGSRLVEALNELMALFTPARWAYEDVDLRYRGGVAAGKELGFQIGESVQAALSLNTAQLNLFTVALFLLCAVRTDNPLGLMVLDDPLQNMDELTVTMLARGIAKVSRIWGEKWRLLLFFHGQEDRERFRREVPLSAYQLPWLSLGEEASGKPIKIPVDKACNDGGLQLLTDVARTLQRSDLP